MTAADADGSDAEGGDVEASDAGESDDEEGIVECDGSEADSDTADFDSATHDAYVVAVKPSARRASRGAGEWVRQRGARRWFETKELARRWARELSGPKRTVWVQDANQNDASDVDGYLVAGRRARTSPVETDRGQGSLDTY